MKLVGIVGKPGSGKTTITEYLEQKDSVGVIHVDELFLKVKQEKFRLFLRDKSKKIKDEKNIKANDPRVRFNPKLKRKIFASSILFSLAMKLRNRLLDKPIQDEINKLQAEGKKTIFIDDWSLMYNKKYYNKCAHIIVMKRRPLERREGLRKRDKLSLEEINANDVPFTKIKYPKKGAFVSVIENYGSKEDLYRTVEEEYQKFAELSFDEKYRVELKGNTFDYVRKCASLNKSKQTTHEEK